MPHLLQHDSRPVDLRTSRHIGRFAESDIQLQPEAQSQEQYQTAQRGADEPIRPRSSGHSRSQGHSCTTRFSHGTSHDCKSTKGRKQLRRYRPLLPCRLAGVHRHAMRERSDSRRRRRKQTGPLCRRAKDIHHAGYPYAKICGRDCHTTNGSPPTTFQATLGQHKPVARRKTPGNSELYRGLS